MNEPYSILEDRLTFHLHNGQERAHKSKARIVLVLAGTQSGKTVYGPIWLFQQMQREGPGDYLIATPTFKLLEVKALPAFLHLFRSTILLGKYRGSPIRQFQFTERMSKEVHGANWDGTPTNVFFGHAQDSDSLESATIKAAWLDEAGQKKFKYDSYLAIRRRLSIHQGRMLITTTPYNLGWLKQHVYDEWKAGNPDIDVIRFESVLNPAFPAEEFEAARRDLPAWKFQMFYQGIFTRPAGLIYDSFDPDKDLIPRFVIPDGWERFVGLDFGGVNTAAMFYARDPVSGLLYAYREYHQGGQTALGHVLALQRGEPAPLTAFGGSRSEDHWRREFSQAGLHVAEPLVAPVEIGISRVYGMHKAGQIKVFQDLSNYLDEKLTYSRVTDETGSPLEEIDGKASYHLMDAERYVIASLSAGAQSDAVSAWIQPVDPLKGLGWPKW